MLQKEYMDVFIIVSILVAGFFLGSIPFGIIVAKLKGVDLKKVGSGNIGATNVLRSMGKGAAFITLFGDIFKGTLAVFLGEKLGVGVLYEGLAGISAILGHNFSIFLGFKGGKGVATSIGVLIIYTPRVALITMIIWLLVVILTRYSSLGALVSFSFLPLNILLFDSKDKFIVAFLITVLIFIRHKDNIRRLMNGTERRIGQRE